MIERYIEATSEVTDLVEEVIESTFPDLRDAKIYCVFDQKKRKSKGSIVLAEIKKANKLIKFLTSDNVNSEGFDYILFIDQLFWDFAGDMEKLRCIRHELQHCEIDPENENDPFKLRGHELQDFYDEIKFNENDPRWMERCRTFVEARYEQIKEQEKIAKKKQKGF